LGRTGSAAPRLRRARARVLRRRLRLYVSAVLARGSPNASEARAPTALEGAAQRLLALDCFEEGFEIAIPKTACALALDHLEEERRPVLRGLREDLEQVAVVVAVGEDPQPLEVAVVLLDLADAVGDVLVVRVRRPEEGDAAPLQRLDRLHDVRRRQRNVLDA